MGGRGDISFFENIDHCEYLNALTILRAMLSFESFGLFSNLWNFLESFGMFLNLMEFFGFFLEFLGIFWNFLELFGCFWNLLEVI